MGGMKAGGGWDAFEPNTAKINDAKKENCSGQGDGDTGDADDTSNDGRSNAETEGDTDTTGGDDTGCKTWLEVLPSKGGMLLAVLLAEIMTEGLTPEQMNILGNFISSVGSLISYKASRDDIDVQ